MRYSLVLIFNTKNPAEVFQIFGSEAGKKDRSEIKIKKQKERIIFEVSAKDAVALKASVNLILKILTIYEKTESLVKNG